ncbi:ribose-phosphate pyrophosphokinase [Ferroglobus placidus DSM 10642]|uniref:ribose-phosphate diphosphokinase n=1 Tax=Ferroglobus placidus (strain DSM 10642 / AEDII12DO) TaxID=589924 RepID=D3S2C6_FERPA|nr:ribose-phosphate diphosphokinase [Ferroglobus placidus]ADC66617.1 ribose-phosphate pyrophosphokinase [Ferroglobus placidus DSM 10642]
MIIPGSNGFLAVKIARICGENLHLIELEKLKYGEKYVRLTFDVEGEDVYLVNTFHPNPDEIFLENLFVAEALKEYGAKRIYGIFPYIAYSKKGRKLIKGELPPLKVLSKLYDVFEKIYSVNFSGEMDVVNISAAELIGEYFADKLGEKCIVISPDETSEELAKGVAEKLGTDYELMKKIRVDAENVIVSAKKMNLDGYEVLLVDDLIYTGSSMVQAIKIVKRSNAKRIFVSCVHALADMRDLLNIYVSGADEIVATDTVLSYVSKISVAELLAEKVF